MRRRTRREGQNLALQQGRMGVKDHERWLGGLARGENHYNWKGGRSDNRGYVLVRMKEHPRAKSNGYVYEHVLVWEQAHKQPVPTGWVIHHLNGCRDDNRPENLVALPTKKHALILQAVGERICQLEQQLAILQERLLVHPVAEGCLPGSWLPLGVEVGLCE